MSIRSSESRQRRRWGGRIVALLALGAAGFALPLPSQRSAAEAAAAANGGTLCAGGMKSPVDLSFEPAKVQSQNGRGQLTMHVNVKHGFAAKQAAKVKYAVDITTDDGSPVGNVIDSGVVPVAAGAAVDADVVTPPLADGYYKATITVVGTDGAEDGDSQSTMYWRVSRGRVEPLELADWYRQAPSAGKAVAL